MQEETLIRVLVVDDHTVLRKGLCSLLTAKYGIEVIGEAGDGFEAVEQARMLQPDVILMDLMMPHKTGLDAILEIRRENPAARILVLTSFGEDSKVSAAIKAGAMGFLMKDSSLDELVHAIRTVHMGSLQLPQDLARKAMAGLYGPDASPAPVEQLTRRELDVLKCIARGMSNEETATELTITVWTVSSHVHNLLEKLNLSSRTQAALYAVEIGLVTPGAEV
jgi:NarL family two-component system response regulator LiaR